MKIFEKIRQKLLKKMTGLIFLCCLPIHALALTTQKQIWGDLTLTGGLFQTANFLYLFEVQEHGGTNPHDLERNNLFTGLGYQYSPTLNFFVGYQWNSNNLSFNNDQQVNRFWQQIAWTMIKNSSYTLTSRSRFEERLLMGQGQWNDRLRQEFTLKLPKMILNRYTPVVYDEIFFNLTRPNWVKTGLVDQNRAFLGVDIPVWKQSFVELGYLNQFIYTLGDHRMNNILYIGLTVNT